MLLTRRPASSCATAARSRVELADGTTIDAPRGVLADVGAPALYRDLVGEAHLPAAFVRDLDRFQYDSRHVQDRLGDRRLRSRGAPEPATRAGTVHLAREHGLRHAVRRRPRDGPDPGAPLRAARADEQGRPHPLTGGHRDGLGLQPRAATSPAATPAASSRHVGRRRHRALRRPDGSGDRGARARASAPASPARHVLAAARARGPRRQPHRAARSAAARWRSPSSSCSGPCPGSGAPRPRSAACSSRRRRPIPAVASTARAARTPPAPRSLADRLRPSPSRIPTRLHEVAQLPPSGAERGEVEHAARFDVGEHRAVPTGCVGVRGDPPVDAIDGLGAGRRSSEYGLGELAVRSATSSRSAARASVCHRSARGSSAMRSRNQSSLSRSASVKCTRAASSTSTPRTRPTPRDREAGAASAIAATPLARARTDTDGAQSVCERGAFRSVETDEQVGQGADQRRDGCLEPLDGRPQLQRVHRGGPTTARLRSTVPPHREEHRVLRRRRHDEVERRRSRAHVDHAEARPRAITCARATRGSGAPVSSSSRERKLIPARFTTAFATTVAVISRRSAWRVDLARRTARGSVTGSSRRGRVAGTGRRERRMRPARVGAPACVNASITASSGAASPKPAAWPFLDLLARREAVRARDRARRPARGARSGARARRRASAPRPAAISSALVCASLSASTSSATSSVISVSSAIRSSARSVRRRSRRATGS